VIDWHLLAEWGIVLAGVLVLWMLLALAAFGVYQLVT
jgi:hypothetical protein